MKVWVYVTLVSVVCLLCVGVFAGLVFLRKKRQGRASNGDGGDGNDRTSHGTTVVVTSPSACSPQCPTVATPAVDIPEDTEGRMANERDSVPWPSTSPTIQIRSTQIPTIVCEDAYPVVNGSDGDGGVDDDFAQYMARRRHDSREQTSCDAFSDTASVDETLLSPRPLSATKHNSDDDSTSNLSSRKSDIKKGVGLGVPMPTSPERMATSVQRKRSGGEIEHTMFNESGVGPPLEKRASFSGKTVPPAA